MFLSKTRNIEPGELCCGESGMPVVQVEMWEGRTDDQKEKLIKGITKAFEEIGVKPEHLTVIIHDVPKSNWGMLGKQASKISP